ncbi:MAG TPA: SUMF1/EgtB/PvdO family nonheme iron enzyme [Kiritimatiellia bacterium]|nr:SUMF1/EgtB/PvdO family nonheme iron enzyme [Kiritimatiellia bacterium]
MKRSGVITRKADRKPSYRIALALIVIGASLAGCGQRPEAPRKTPSEPAPPPGSWRNSLGIGFFPVPERPDTLLAVWPTRVKDFAAFVEATGHDATDRFFYYHNNSWNTGDRYWRNPGFEQTDHHPVIGVSWRDAVAFCLWLTEHERRAGLIPARQNYRLPTDEEWTLAAGPPLEGDLPFNYANYHPLLDVDTFEFTSPVGSFPPNSFGFYDMAGNTWEYCLDLHSSRENFRVIRGGCWQNWHARFVGVQARGYCGPDVRITLYGFRIALAENSDLLKEMETGLRQQDPPPDLTIEW